MMLNKKRLSIILLSICTLTVLVLFISFRKSTSIYLEDKFGTFCLECRANETGSGISVYGFGIAYCDDEIKQMTNKINYEEIEKFKMYLDSKGFSNLSNKVSYISDNLKKNDTEKYFVSVKDYEKEINQLSYSEKNIILSYF